MKLYRTLTLAAVLLAALFFITGIVAALSVADTAVQPADISYSYADQHDDQRYALRDAIFWVVEEHQNDDGGFSSFSSGANLAPSDVGGTVDALVALGSAGYDARAIFPGKSAAPLDFLQGHANEVTAYAAANGGQAGKLILALTATAEDSRNFLGHNFVISLTEQLSPTGQLNVNDPFNQSLAILALAAAHEPIPAAAVEWLQDKQASNGSWDDGFGTLNSTDATAMAIMALLAADTAASDANITMAREFLAENQLPSGGWAYAPGLPESVNSTALALQALKALGEDFFSPNGPWAQNGNRPVTALLSYQNANGGFEIDFGTGPTVNFFATVQAIPGVTGKAYPLPARLEEAFHALSCLEGLQDPTTGGWEQFAGFGVNAAGTSRVIQAIAAAGGDPQSDRWTTAGGTNAVEALETLTPDYVAGGRGGRTGTVMQGVVAAGDPYTVTDFAGLDLVMVISDYLSPTGEYDSTAFGIFSHAEAMLGLMAAEQPVDSTAVDFLLHAHSGGNFGDHDANGIALQILGRLDQPIPHGTLGTIRKSQGPDGGWGFDVVASPNSTSEIVQGLVAIGENPFAPYWSQVVSGTVTNAADAVLATQAENGCWPNLFGPGDDPSATTDAVILLTQHPDWGFVSADLYLPVIQP